MRILDMRERGGRIIYYSTGGSAFVELNAAAFSLCVQSFFFFFSAYIFSLVVFAAAAAAAPSAAAATFFDVRNYEEGGKNAHYSIRIWRLHFLSSSPF